MERTAAALDSGIATNRPAAARIVSGGRDVGAAAGVKCAGTVIVAGIAWIVVLGLFRWHLRARPCFGRIGC